MVDNRAAKRSTQSESALRARCAASNFSDMDNAITRWRKSRSKLPRRPGGFGYFAPNLPLTGRPIVQLITRIVILQRTSTIHRCGNLPP